ncbi:TetR family transcriptional regulator [Microlunatus endophyticus]|uniref:TetR family transcriptional regulator n=1 Tax=Microlunatus endophyticus TaxID=1716077 RepID=A0A917W5H0_9ACTN|nr:TetR/AcrR family transcriptional regulator [Microlunatus endophyticus]GGL64887.1 TetR family transcriptional regulator [Microlunatus endophyticus]
MASASTAAETATRPVRERILQAADTLFYGDGIRAVSADRIIAAAGVSKVTFYRHFPTKDDLVVGYLTARSADERRGVERLQAAFPDDPAQVLEQIARTMVRARCEESFRGCTWINAAAEYPDADHPVRRTIADHRTWFRQVLSDQLRALGVTETAPVVEQLMILRDGAMVTGYIGPGTDDPQPLISAGRAVIAATVAAQAD